MEKFHYDPKTGLFTRISKTIGRSIKGSIAGSFKTNGYIQIEIKGKKYLAHRLAWLYITGEMPKDMIDHINNNKSDNRFSNLRESNRSQNKMNTPIRKDNKCGYKGVVFKDKYNKFEARIRINKTLIYLGLFLTAKDASEAYENYAKINQGEFYYKEVK